MIYEIGKWYRVPCVFGKVYSMERWWPVMGPKHEDAEFIQFPQQHYHIDWRFVPKRCMPITPTFALAVPLTETTPTDAWYPRNANLGKPEPRRAKCIRETPSPYPRGRATWLPRLEAAYTGCKLKPGMVCPHRGIPLESIPAIAGVVTCPGHGLRWNVATGELVVDHEIAGPPDLRVREFPA